MGLGSGSGKDSHAGCSAGMWPHTCLSQEPWSLQVRQDDLGRTPGKWAPGRRALGTWQLQAVPSWVSRAHCAWGPGSSTNAFHLQTNPQDPGDSLLQLLETRGHGLGGLSLEGWCWAPPVLHPSPGTGWDTQRPPLHRP